MARKMSLQAGNSLNGYAQGCPDSKEPRRTASSECCLACPKFIKLNVPNVKATGDSSMVDSEVNIKITGPNENVTQRNINANPSTNKTLCSKDKTLCKYFSTNPHRYLIQL